ncbi:MAG: sugar kinase [Desulfovibrionaceae bacterium]|nr:sugar kinase [Desulfovibrionaceae bacterium]
MLVVAGTVPDPDYPLVCGEVLLEGAHVSVRGARAEVNRGTPALLAAAVLAARVLDRPGPTAWLVGDTGLGRGSRRLYAQLAGSPGPQGVGVFVFHYLQPDVDWHDRVLMAVQDLPGPPRLVADAGFMYAAKMSGQAGAYDLFTPDAGELAFLADEKAPHPFYTRGFVLHEPERAPGHIARAFEFGNAARCLLVKGAVDHVADSRGVLAVIDEHPEEAMEAVGGTGDTLTGLAAALMDSGLDTVRAAVLAARANRLAGSLAKPTPASQVLEIIENIPRALSAVLAEADLEKA